MKQNNETKSNWRDAPLNDKKNNVNDDENFLHNRCISIKLTNKLDFCNSHWAKLPEWNPTLPTYSATRGKFSFASERRSTMIRLFAQTVDSNYIMRCSSLDRFFIWCSPAPWHFSLRAVSSIFSSPSSHLSKNKIFNETRIYREDRSLFRSILTKDCLPQLSLLFMYTCFASFPKKSTDSEEGTHFCEELVSSV